jgi:hypothetical protein
VAKAGAGSKHVFEVASYEADEKGVLRPVLPGRCPFVRGAQGCHLYVDHYRRRKTGPRFPLAVVGCREHPHGRSTLYLPGHVPYGREPVVPCSPSGEVGVEVSTGDPLWGATVFKAALDAAKGERWPADSPWDDPRRRRTQGRRLGLAGRLLGVHPGQDERTRERIAARLGVPLVRLVDQARRWGRKWSTRGAALVAVLLMWSSPDPGGSVLERLLAAGAVADLWPEPRGAMAVSGRWASVRSGSSEHPLWGHPPSRAPPPTTLRPPRSGSGM